MHELVEGNVRIVISQVGTALDAANGLNYFGSCHGSGWDATHAKLPLLERRQRAAEER